jgi:hypothetical protein
MLRRIASGLSKSQPLAEELLFLRMTDIIPVTATSVATKPALVIGLNGVANVGKDTIGAYLQTSWLFRQVSFAGPLKNAASELFGVPIESFHDRIKKEQVVERWGASPRRLCQWLGTDVMRTQFDKEFFLKRTDYAINSARQDFVEEVPRIVITDVRFDNEAEYIINNWNGVIWHIDAGERVGSTLSTESAAHESEKGISPHLISHEIDNSGSLEFCFQQVDNHLLSLL